MPADVLKPATLSTETAVLNVHARLCNSNPVKEALPAVLKDVQRALGVRIDDDSLPKKKRLRAKDHEGPHDGHARSPRKLEVKARKDTSDVDAASGEEEVGGRKLQDNKSDAEASEDEFADFEDRLASSDDDEASDDEDLDVDAIERQLALEGVRRKTPSQPYDHTAALSLSPSPDQHSNSSTPEPQKASQPPAAKKSSFLPSLSLGGYISGSGSDLDSDIDAPARKNRPGQRARQQIWEKKYGARAKHLQKEKTRDAGWDPRKGATESTDRRGKGGSQRERFAGGGGGRAGRSGRSGEVRGGERAGAGAGAGEKKKHRDDGGAIHPSWEAAKKAKERKEGVPAFSGKKITFD